MDTRGVRVLKPKRDGVRFTMGDGVNWKVLFPEMGARNITLNYVEHAPGVTFTPHVHEQSEDVIVVLSGHGTIVSNDDIVPFEAGDVLYVPAGVYHGTTNTGDEPLIMFSCQAPPDPALYTGQKDRR
ncbi:MAG: cupin domain-containing protein [Chloroflexi bacterium]|nr:cupin domain-containing protein [Chloroflexota bacterium]